MNEGRDEPGQEGGPPEPGPAGSSPEPRGGDLASHMGWIVSANVVALLALVLAVVALVFHFTDEDEEGGAAAVAQPTATAQATPTPAAQPTPTPIVVENVSVDDDPSWGPEDAPVTIVEFSDYQCPFCARFFLQTYPQIRQEYEGKIRFVFRDYPLPPSMHPDAQAAAEATECADDQDKFWDYHDLLWTKQDALDVDSLKSYAADLELDTATFNECLDTGKNTAEVQKDLQDGESYGVRGTPAFFVNGRLVAGAIPFEDYTTQQGPQPGFQTIIDAALEEAEAGSAIPVAPSGGG